MAHRGTYFFHQFELHPEEEPGGAPEADGGPNRPHEGAPEDEPSVPAPGQRPPRSADRGYFGRGRSRKLRLLQILLELESRAGRCCRSFTDEQQRQDSNER